MPSCLAWLCTSIGDADGRVVGLHGAMAQLAAHLLCKQGVRGSSPLGSTTKPQVKTPSGMIRRRGICLYRPPVATFAAGILKIESCSEEG